MKPIIILMLCVQAFIILAVAYAVAVRKPTSARPGPIWLSFAISLFVVGASSINIGRDYLPDAAGVEVLMFVGAILIGMAIMCLFLVARKRFSATG